MLRLRQTLLSMCVSHVQYHIFVLDTMKGCYQGASNPPTHTWQCIFQIFFSRLRPLELVLLRASCLVVSTDMHCMVVSDLEQLFQWQCVLQFWHRFFSTSQHFAPFLSTFSSIDLHLIRRDQDFPWSLWLVVILHRHPNCQKLMGETAVRFQTATQWTVYWALLD